VTATANNNADDHHDGEQLRQKPLQQRLQLLPQLPAMTTNEHHTFMRR
jgi:hypothetical protein